MRLSDLLSKRITQSGKNAPGEKRSLLGNFLRMIATMNVVVLTGITGCFTLVISMCFLVPVILIFGKPNEDMRAILEKLTIKQEILFAVVIGPLWESICFQFIPIFLAFLIIRKFAKRHVKEIGWALVGLTVLSFAGVHGFNASPFDWRSVSIRIPAAVILSGLCFAQLAYVDRPKLKAICRAALLPVAVHAVSNGIVTTFHILAFRT